MAINYHYMDLRMAIAAKKIYEADKRHKTIQKPKAAKNISWTLSYSKKKRGTFVNCSH